jgi:hypothetical protein
MTAAALVISAGGGRRFVASSFSASAATGAHLLAEQGLLDGDRVLEVGRVRVHNVNVARIDLSQSVDVGHRRRRRPFSGATRTAGNTRSR